MSAPLLVAVAHDAGGAELVAAWLARHRSSWTARAVLQGPAVGVFARRLGAAVPGLPTLPDLREAGFVLCGSSGRARLEREAVRAARAAGVRCAVWLDHWTNYAERFVLDGMSVLPDEVWVADEHAAVRARAGLPGAEVRLIGNPYLEDLAAEVAQLERRTASGGDGATERVLYVTEPTSSAAERLTGDPRGFGYSEHEALEAFLAWRARERRPASVRLRTHPAEAFDKYDWAIGRSERAVTVERSCGRTLAEDIAWAQTVAGCDTMAMVAARVAGRRVLSALPSVAPPPAIPQDGITRLFPPTMPVASRGLDRWPE